MVTWPKVPPPPMVTWPKTSSSPNGHMTQTSSSPNGHMTQSSSSLNDHMTQILPPLSLVTWPKQSLPQWSHDPNTLYFNDHMTQTLLQMVTWPKHPLPQQSHDPNTLSPRITWSKLTPMHNHSCIHQTVEHISCNIIKLYTEVLIVKTTQLSAKGTQWTLV